MVIGSRKMLDPRCQGRTRTNESDSWISVLRRIQGVLFVTGENHYACLALSLLLINAGKRPPSLSLDDHNFQNGT